MGKWWWHRYFHVQIYVKSNGTLSAYMNRSNTNYSITTDEIKPSYWNHIAMVLQGSTLRLYVNGKQMGTTTVSGSPVNAAQPFFIGSDKWFIRSSVILLCRTHNQCSSCERCCCLSRWTRLQTIN